jgi:serine/threonine-protein kinase RsbW
MAAGRTLTAPAAPASVDLVHRLLQELWAECAADGPAAEDRIRFETALVEVAGNIAEHSGAREFVLHVVVHPDRLVADFSDDGAGFGGDPGAAALPDDPLASSGRGLALARAAVHELAYERAGTQNRWHVVRERGGGRAGADSAHAP